MKTMSKVAAALACATVLFSTAVAADWEPKGPIKMVIAFAAGGGADTSGRLIAAQMEEATGWKIIPEQITGKGGVNAAKALKDMPNDGTAIALVVTETLGFNAASAEKAGIKPADFTGLTTTAGFQMGVVAKADKGWKTFDDMLKAAKGGEKIRFGAMSPKLADLAYLLGKAQGVDFNIITVRGGKAVMNGVTAGDMDVGFMAGIQAKGVASGELVNLASALSAPLKQTPDAPTFKDLGVDFNADGYFVFIAPAGMPDDAREGLTNALTAAAQAGKAGALFKKAFGGNTLIKGEALDKLLQSEYDSAGALLEAAGE